MWDFAVGINTLANLTFFEATTLRLGNKEGRRNQNIEGREEEKPIKMYLGREFIIIYTLAF